MDMDIMDDDQAMHQALVSFITRASAVGMIPIYDLLNHHNGERNAKLLLNEEGVMYYWLPWSPFDKERN
jgi:hypothetical protein